MQQPQQLQQYLDPKTIIVSSLVEALGRHLEKVILTQSVLGVAGVVLEQLLDLVVVRDSQRQRLGAQVPGNILGAGRSGQGAGVFVDAVHIQVVGQTGEVHLASVGEGTGLLDVDDAVEDGVEQGNGVSELGELEEKADDGSFFGCIA